MDQTQNLKTTTVRGGRVSYLDLNPKSTKVVVFVHGITGSHILLANIGQQLQRQGYRVLIPNLPGHGGSEAMSVVHTPEHFAQWLRDFVRTCVAKDNDVILIGHSFGCLVTLAALELKQFHSALLITPPVKSFGGSLLTSLYIAIGRLLPQNLKRRWLFAPFPFVTIPRLLHDQSKQKREIITRTCEYENKMYDPTAVIEAFSSISKTLRHLQSRQYKKPVRIIAAAQDAIAPPQAAQGQWKNIWHQRETIIVANAGHQVFVDQPEAILAAVRTSLDSITGPQT